MPLPKSDPAPSTLPIFISANAVAKLAGCHRDGVLRALARGEIEPDAYLDLEGTLQPVFRTAAAITLAAIVSTRRGNHHPEAQ